MSNPIYVVIVRTPSQPIYITKTNLIVARNVFDWWRDELDSPNPQDNASRVDLLSVTPAQTTTLASWI